MARVFLRSIGLILTLCILSVGLMRGIGSLRQQGAILVSFNTDGTSNLGFVNTGSILKIPRNELPTLSPDACYYLSSYNNEEARQGEIALYNILGEATNKLVIPNYASTWKTFWSADSHYIAFTNMDLASGGLLLTIMDSQSGAIWQVFNEPIQVNSIIQWSPHDHYIALTGYSQALGQTVFIYDLKKRQMIGIQGEGLDTTNRIVWSIDERYLLVIMGSSTPENLGIVDLNNARFHPIEGLQSIRAQASWSPNGQLFVAGQAQGDIEERLYQVSAETGDYQAIQSLPYGTLLGEWTRDGQYMLYFDTQTRIINIFDANLKHAWAIPQQSGGDMISYWAEDNQHFSVRLSGGKLWIIDPANEKFYPTGQKISQLFTWLNNEQFIYVTNEHETNLAQFRDGQFKILAQYPLRQLQGVCVPEHN